MSGKITKFVMEDVRCFAGKQEFEIRPLTFLVGENSTGKSTALGCFHVLANYLSREFRRSYALDFNVEPYSMGSFTDIVSRKRPSGKNFQLGFRIKINNKQAIEYMIRLVEKQQFSEPMLDRIKIKFHDGEICFNHKDPKESSEFKEKDFEIRPTDGTQNIFQIDCNLFDPWSYLDILFNFHHFPRRYSNSKTAKGENELKTLREFLSKKELRKIVGHSLTTFSFAPIRSRPKRTYDPTREFEDPEGGDIPMLIRRMENMKSHQWASLKNQLVKFGKDSCLFEGIEVKKHGKSMSDSFQIQVKVRGPKSNIMDVGYGINQILPILIRILSDKHSRFFLMQQPEVHLHPRGQAELASLFTRIVKEKRQFLIVETHSDYIIDRTRIEIQKNSIKPEDVSLIYMEPKGSHVKVHNIGFDELGNLTGAPKSYRDFFSKETDALLGFGEKPCA